MVRKWLVRLRGALGIGTVWGALGATIATLVGLGGVALGQLPLSAVLEIALGAGGLGLLLGSGFGVALTLVEGNRRLDELTVGRAALWGGLVGAVAPVGILLLAIAPTIGFAPILNWQALVATLSGAVAYGAVCAGLAAGTIAIAKRGPDEVGPPKDEAPMLPSTPTS